MKACIGLLVLLSAWSLFADPAAAGSEDLEWCGFLGGSDSELGYAITLDDAGNIYVAGITESVDFPFTAGAVDSTHNGQGDIFVALIDSTGTTIEYATYLGGSQNDNPYSIEVDDSNFVYVAGYTSSPNFPVTASAFDTLYEGSCEAFALKMDPTLSDLIFATYIGGSIEDQGYAMDIDDLGHMYVTGRTNSYDFPVTPGAYDTYRENMFSEVFVAKLNADGSDLVYATFLGKDGDDQGVGIAVDDSGCACVAGATNSDDFPVTPGAFDTVYASSRKGFVTKFNQDGSDLVYSTFVGGSYNDVCLAIAIDDSNNVYVTGYTYSDDLPCSPDAFDTTYGTGSMDAFVIKLNPDGSGLIYGTYLGGSAEDEAYGITVNDLGYAYVTGSTKSDDFPTTTGALDTVYVDREDLFMSVLNPGGSALDYSTLMTGSSVDEGRAITVDHAGDAYLTGYTYSTEFPSTPGSFDATLNGEFDAMVAKFDIGMIDTSPPEAIDDLSISVENLTKGGDIRLSWSEPDDDMGIIRYVVYRSRSVNETGDSVAGVSDTTCLDAGAVGDQDTSYSYTVEAVDGGHNRSPASNRVGEIDWALATTTGTDYAWLALALDDSTLAMASDLEAAIEAHSSPAVNCLTVSQWNPTAQTYTHYTTVPVPMGDFALTEGLPCRVETDASGVFTLTGAVPPAGSLSFDLETTTGTDYTWISLPLELDGLDMASDLEDHIEAHSDPATDCLTISRWNPTAQTYTHYTTVPIPMGDFAIAPGRPYRVEVTSDALWPYAGKGTQPLQRVLHTR
jgi:hypothetical protein